MKNANLGHFFSNNMIYGIARTQSNDWIPFNREYYPLGWDCSSRSQNRPYFNVRDLLENPNEQIDYLITKYKGITDKLLNEISTSRELDENDRITMCWFYSSTEMTDAELNDYFRRITKLLKLSEAE